ncbi:hypothetical protein D3C72_2497420 [compost metagenome]
MCATPEKSTAFSRNGKCAHRPRLFADRSDGDSDDTISLPQSDQAVGTPANVCWNA